MSILTLYAGSTSSLTSANKLPSPTGFKASHEQIWSEDTGRAQSGSNQAKMIGESVAQKKTYAIEWGVLEYADFSTIESLLSPGFFYFGIGTPTTPPSTPTEFYRGEIQYDVIQVGTTRYYKGVAVQVIER